MNNTKMIAIKNCINNILVDFNNQPTALVTEDMFTTDDIKKIQKHRSDPSLIFITFYGINGSVPIRFFDEKAQQKIKNFLKIRNSKLWESVNSEN